MQNSTLTESINTSHQAGEITSAFTQINTETTSRVEEIQRLNSQPRDDQQNPKITMKEFEQIRDFSNSENLVYNWSKTNVLAYEHQVLFPKTEQEVQEIVVKANLNGQKIRVIGSALTYEPLVSIINEGPDAILMNLKNLHGLVETTTSTVTFKAGTLLDTVFQYLIDNNRMLPCSPGVIGAQTIAGAIATGTHGQGMYCSAISDVISMMKVVLPNGELVQIKDDDENFGAFSMAMGCLGVVTEITFKTEENKILTCQKISCDEEYLFEKFEEINLTHRFAKFWWFSWTKEVHMWYTRFATEEEIQKYRDNKDKLVNIGEKIDESINRTIDQAANKMALDTQDLEHKGKHFETVYRFKNATDVTGNIFQILCKGIPAPQINCEIAVPFERMPEVFKALRTWQEENPNSLHYPLILRCNGPSKAWLCPAYNKNVCYIGFLVYLAKDGKYREGSMEMMRSLQEVLSKYGGIPHLGKHFVNELYDFPKLIPRWNDFIALKNKLDPNRIFENQYLRKLFNENEQEEIELWLVRHGETEENYRRIMQGQMPGTLSSEGKEQAKGVGKRLAQENFAEIYCSDLKRTKDTLSIAMQEFSNPNLEVVYTPLLREKSGGVLEGGPLDAMYKKAEELGIPFKKYRPENGENWEDALKRFKEFIDLVKSKYFSVENKDVKKTQKRPKILVMTHGGLIRESFDLIDEINQVANRVEYKDPNNCSINVLKISKSKFENDFRFEFMSKNDVNHFA